MNIPVYQELWDRQALVDDTQLIQRVTATDVISSDGELAYAKRIWSWQIHLVLPSGRLRAVTDDYVFSCELAQPAVPGGPIGVLPTDVEHGHHGLRLCADWCTSYGPAWIAGNTESGQIWQPPADWHYQQAR